MSPLTSAASPHLKAILCYRFSSPVFHTSLFPGSRHSPPAAPDSFRLPALSLSDRFLPAPLFCRCRKFIFCPAFGGCPSRLAGRIFRSPFSAVSSFFYTPPSTGRSLLPTTPVLFFRQPPAALFAYTRIFPHVHSSTAYFPPQNSQPKNKTVPKNGHIFRDGSFVLVSVYLP